MVATGIKKPPGDPAVLLILIVPENQSCHAQKETGRFGASTS